MRKLILIFAVITPLLCGCERSDRNGNARPVSPAGSGSSARPQEPGAAPASPGSPATGTATPVPVPPGTPSRADEIASEPTVREWREVVVPAGTQLDIELENSVGSDTSRVEEPVRAQLVENVVVHGTTALPAGSPVTGTVTNAKRPGKVKGVAELGIRFDTVKPKDGDSSYRMRTGVVTRRGQATHKKDALTILGPAAGGALVGGLFGGKKGALIGTTIGGGAGTAVVFTTRGKEVRLPKGAHLVIKLMDPLTVRVPA